MTIEKNKNSDIKRVILITGASSGFGKVCAEFLSQGGYSVYGTSRKPNEQTMPYEMIAMDVNDDASVTAGVRYIMDKEGRLDVVINNAGMGIAGALEDTTVEELKFQFETNFFGAFRVCRETLPIMRAQQSGCIINIGSIGGIIGIPFQGAYSASKFALEGLTEVMRMEAKPFGVDCVLVEPGDFSTGFTDNRIKTEQSQAGSPYFDRFNAALQVMEEDERNGASPMELARLVKMIIEHPSPRSRYTVGPLMQKVGVHLKKLIPSRWFEKIIMSTYKI